jgi:hypothetical protein
VRNDVSNALACVCARGLILRNQVCNHVAEALDSVPSFKFFIFGGQTCGNSEEEMSNWRYSSEINIMDCSTKAWINMEIGGSQQPGTREDSAWAYDPKTARLILYGGWSDEWLRLVIRAMSSIIFCNSLTAVMNLGNASVLRRLFPS